MHSKQLSKFSVMKTLVKREFLEHRALFVYVPLLVVGMVAVYIVAAFLKVYPEARFIDVISSVPGTGFSQGPTVSDFAAAPEATRVRIMRGFYTTVTSFPLIPYWGTMLYYFMTTLYQQRKDRSVLFWNSMPVSSAQTVISKLLTGMVCCQVICLACSLLLQLFLLATMLFYASLFDIATWQAVGAPSNVLSMIGTMVAQTALTVTWTLPVYAWLLLWSGAARSMPFAWAIGPFALIMGLETWLAEDMPVTELVMNHTIPLGMFNSWSMILNADRLTELAIATLLGIALVYAAIRFNRSEEL